MTVDIVMVHIHFNSELQRVTGVAQLSLAVSNYRELIDTLVKHYDFEAGQLTEMAVAINGLIIHEPLLEKFEDGSEVHFLHRISGG